MPDYEWTCTACGEQNPPYTEACRNCYTLAVPNVIQTESAPPLPSLSPAMDPPASPKLQPLVAQSASPNAEYVPNEIPAGTRVQNTLISIALMTYGAFGLWINDLYIPGKRSKGIHLHGIAAWVMYGAFLGACLALLSVVVDHYDRRNNELQYKQFTDACRYVGWGLFILSLIIEIAYKP